MDLMKYTEKVFHIENQYVREFLAELLATFLLVAVGVSAVAQYVLYNSLPSLSIAIAFSFAIAMGIIIAGNISGGHMNPAVSIAFLIIGQLTPLRFLIYLCGQFLGAFIGAVSVYVTYLDALNKFDNGKRQISGSNGTAGIWATYPSNGVSIMGAFFDQFFSTFLFVLLILAITDKKSGNNKRPAEIQAILVGISCLIIACGFSSNCGGAINPFRDLAPRFFTAIAGWGFGVFTVHHYFFWIPIVAPLVGGAFAANIYALLIRNHWPINNTDEEHNHEEGTEFIQILPQKAH